MTINQIEAFCILAETLNYTKAAMLHYTTQPTLSKIIVNLEQEIGVQLFYRSKRGVRLTAAGETFYTEIKAMMEQYKQALTKTRFVDAEIRGEVVIGFLGSAVTRVMPKFVNRFRAENPNINLKMVDYTYSPLVQALDEKQVDIAILLDSELDVIRGIDQIYTKLVYADDMCLVVSKDHRFAETDSIDLDLIVKEPFIMIDPEISVRNVGLLSVVCREGDFTPNVVCRANTLNTLLMMVECNLGVAILARHMTHFATENIRFIPIKGFEGFLKIVCAWWDQENTAVMRFVDLI